MAASGEGHWFDPLTSVVVAGQLLQVQVIFGERGEPPLPAVDRWHWARYVRQVCKTGPGQKPVCIAELWNFCNDDSIPAELAMLAQDGLSDNLHFVFDTQRPELLNPSIVGAAYEVVCFRHHEPRALKAIAGMLGQDPEQVRNLPKGHFVSRTIDGGMTAGKLF